MEEKTRIFHIYDYTTRSLSDELLPGRLVSLKGAGLLPAEGDPEIVLSPVGSEEQIPVTALFKVTDRDLMFNLPDGLEPGDYRIKLLVKRGFTKKEVEYKRTVRIG